MAPRPLQWGECLARLERRGLTRDEASAVLAAAADAGSFAEFEDPATSDERIRELLGNLKAGGSPPNAGLGAASGAPDNSVT